MYVGDHLLLQTAGPGDCFIGIHKSYTAETTDSKPERNRESQVTDLYSGVKPFFLLRKRLCA